MLLVAPALAVIAVFFATPLAYMVVYSFSRFDPARLVVPVFTFENYARFVTDAYLRAAVLRTVRVALLATGTTLVVGYPFAYYMTRARGVEKSVLAVIMLSPLTISEVITGYAWLVLIAPHSGLLSTALQRAGVLSGPLNLMYTETGILIGLTQATLVYMVLSLHAALEAIDTSHLRAAAILGATPAQVFWKVVFPLSLPGVFSGCILVFAISASAFVIPLLLGGPQLPVLTGIAYDLNTTELNWPLGGAAGLVLLVITTASIFLSGAYVARLRKRFGMV
jgi:ABC-type spermidine/putrescine transport system permease subunit I